MEPVLSQKEQEAAQHLLAYYGVGQYARGGSFTTAFIKCLEAADMANTMKLLMAFPEWQQAHHIMTTRGSAALQLVLEQQA